MLPLLAKLFTQPSPPCNDGRTTSAKLPLPAYVRLMRYGAEVATSQGQSEFEFPLKESGAYRLEAWLKLDGEFRPWIFSNPIYVR